MAETKGETKPEQPEAARHAEWHEAKRLKILQRIDGLFLTDEQLVTYLCLNLCDDADSFYLEIPLQALSNMTQRPTSEVLDILEGLVENGLISASRSADGESLVDMGADTVKVSLRRGDRR